MPNRLSIDFETFCELDLKAVGIDVYSKHESCDPLMLAYAFNDKPVKQWRIAEWESIPPELEDGLLDERVVKTAWNANFEKSILKNCLDLTIPPEQWRCTMALSFSLALPGSLDKAGEVVGIAEDQKKASTGRALMRLFSQPRKPSKTKPWTRTHWWRDRAKWDEFLEYNRQDVIAERAILRKLLRFDMPEHEWRLWEIDQTINERGIPINMAAVDNAVRLYETIIEKKTRRLRTITELQNPGSTQQILPWMEKRGYPFEDCKKGHIERAHKTLADRAAAGVDPLAYEEEELQEVLALRLQTSRSSPKKYYALQRAVDRVDGVLRNAFQFAGAGRTWRWAGRLFQVQNLPRPLKAYKKIMEVVVGRLERFDVEELEQVFADPMGLLVSCIRSMAQAPEGFAFYDADLNAIENRGLGWIAQDRKILRVFELGRDPYIDFATYMYHMLYEVLLAEYKAGDDTKRTISKPAVLGCGYRLSAGEEHINRKTGEIEATGLLGYARAMGVNLTPEQAVLSVKVFRETYTEVVQSWYDIERAAKKCLKTGNPTYYHMIRFDMKAPFLRMILPSGRALHYCRPRMEPHKTPWGEWRDALSYEGLNDQNQWIRIPTHGGKLIENATQAIARDLLAHGMVLAHDRGLDLRIHVHDQIVGVAPDIILPGSNMTVAEEHLAVLQECMAEQPDWAIYKGVALPLASNGFVSKVFMKD